MIQSRVINDFEELESIRKVWDQIIENGKLDVSLSYDWSTILWESHLNKSDLNVILVERNSEILGIFSVFIKHKTIRYFPVKTICFIANLNCNHNELIMFDRSNEILSTFFNRLKSIVNFKNWHMMELPSVVVGSSTDCFLKSFLTINRYPFKTLPGIVSPYIPIDNLSWDGYLKSLKKKSRDNITRKKNKIEREGKTEIKQITDYDKIVEIIIRIEKKSWKHKNLTSIIDKEQQMKFYKLLIRKYGSKFLFFVLYFNKNPISYSMGLQHNNKYYSLKTSYDENYKNLSPGIVLRCNLLEYCFKSNFREFDFCGINEHWKREFTKEERKHINYFIFNKGIYSKFIYFLSDFFWRKT